MAQVSTVRNFMQGMALAITFLLPFLYLTFLYLVSSYQPFLTDFVLTLTISKVIAPELQWFPIKLRLFHLNKVTFLVSSPPSLKLWRKESVR